MNTKHNDDILKTRGKNKKGENEQPPSTPQPKKQGYIYTLWTELKTLQKVLYLAENYLQEYEIYDKDKWYIDGKEAIEILKIAIERAKSQ